MGKSVERQIKDAIIAKMETLPGASCVATTARELAVGEGAMEDGAPCVMILFPGAERVESCGFVRLVFPLIVEGRFRYSGDIDELEPATLRDRLDEFEQQVNEFLFADRSWGGLAEDTRPAQRNHKKTNEDVNTPESFIVLAYEIEAHLPPIR